ncbi:MAG: ribosomal-protein-alanine N-acetyltransferase [Candidatus Lokiarchaeota archaeon]|nr:ribosomal-protein-alanine N-acetyltransferase [Candidatus Lokiarchaeota archaeon]
MFKIRPAKKDDLEVLISIEKISFDHPYSDDLMKFIVHNRNAINLIAETENEIIGYVFAILKSDREGHVISIAIKPNFRKKGVGSHLINEIIRILEDNKATKLVLEVRTTNKMAIEFYERIGFKITTKLNKYYDNNEDAYKMELIL